MLSLLEANLFCPLVKQTYIFYFKENQASSIEGT